MGRYLALGIATTIYVKKDKSWYASKNFSVNKNKDKIIKEMNKFLDMSKYDCEETKNCLCFKMKKDHFDNNIYDLLKELELVVNCNETFLWSIFGADEGISFEKIIEQKQGIKLDIYNETYPFEYEYERNQLIGKFYIECNGKSTSERYSPFESPQYWLFDDKLNDNIDVSFGYMYLWRDWNKYVGEDETPMLGLLNTFSRNYFKNPLSKNILFYIDG